MRDVCPSMHQRLEQSYPQPSGRGGMDFARVPIELWEDLRRCLSRALREKRAARDEAVKLREALKGYK